MATISELPLKQWIVHQEKEFDGKYFWKPIVYGFHNKRHILTLCDFIKTAVYVSKVRLQKIRTFIFDDDVIFSLHQVCSVPELIVVDKEKSFIDYDFLNGLPSNCCVDWANDQKTISSLSEVHPHKGLLKVSDYEILEKLKKMFQ